MIFISDFDPFKLNRNHYEIKEYVDNSEVCYNDGVHRLYFNTAVKDDSRLSDLLQYLANSDPDNNNFGALSQQVNYHKYQVEGVGNMCKAVEEYAEKRKEEGRLEGKLETIKNMLKNNISLDVALKCAQIDKATYEKYAEQF